MSTICITGQQTTNMFVYMHTAAKHMRDLASASEEGRMYALISSLVFSAFTMEAYLNHLGKLRNQDWDEVERKFPKLEKYKMFCRAAELNLHLNRRPHSTLDHLFQFRDQMAHGKTTTDNISIELPIEDKKDSSMRAENKWQSFATIKHASEAILDVEEMIKELHISMGYPGDPFCLAGDGVFSLHTTK